MKKKRIIIGFLFTIIFVILMQANALAANFKFEVVSNKTKVKPGNTVELTFSISNINIGTAGMNTIEADLDYDKSIFEEVTSDSIKGLNDWVYKYNPSKKKLLGYIYSMGVDTKEEICTISFKVKKGSKLGNTEIKINNITTNDGEKLITTENATQTIKISDTEDSDPDSGEPHIVDVRKTENEDGSVTIEIEFDKEVAEVPEGWEILEDGKTIRKTYSKEDADKIENIMVKFKNGYIAIIEVNPKEGTAKIVSAYKEDNPEQRENLAGKLLPQTGQGIIILIVILSLIGIAMFFKIKSSKKWNR